MAIEQYLANPVFAYFLGLVAGAGLMSFITRMTRCSNCCQKGE